MLKTKTKGFYAVIMVLIVTLVLAACGGGGSNTGNTGGGATTGEQPSAPSNQDNKVYEINFNVSAAPTSSYTKNIAEPWAKLVEEKSNGRLKVNIFPSAALGSLETALEDIQNGVYELGLVSPGRQMDTVLFPMTISDLPFTVTSPEVATQVMEKFVNEFLGEDDSFGNAVFLSVFSTDSVNMYSKFPVNTVGDVKGKNISDSAAMRLEMMKDWGASPVQLPNTEIYQALERGTVDASVYTTVGAQGYKLEEVSKYLIRLNTGVIVQGLLINKDFFNSLPEDLQQLLKGELAKEYTRLDVEDYSSKTEAAIKAYQDAGGTVIVPTEEAMQGFRAPVAKLAENWVAEANKRGYDGKAMLEFYGKTLEEAGVVNPFK